MLFTGYLDLESTSNFQVKEKKIIEINPETTKLCLNWMYGHSSIDYRVALLFTGYSDSESQSNFQVKEKKLLKSIQKQRNYVLNV